MFICFLLSLPIFLIVSFILWRIFRQKTQNGNIPGDNDIMDEDDDEEDHEDGGRRHKNILRNEQSLANPDQPPQKIPRKGTLKKNIDFSKPVGASALEDNFLSEFDKREARRKLLQAENDEKLNNLLNWRSPYELYHGSERKIKKQKQPFTNISLLSRKEKDTDKNQKETKTEEKLVERELDKTDDVTHDSSVRRRHSDTPDILKNLKAPGVSKIINFVAIKSQPSEPEYKPRNKIQTKINKLPPIPTPREKRKPSRQLFCPVLNQHHFDDEVIQDEALGSLDDVDVFDESHANEKFAEVCEASSELVETKINLEKTPPIRRSLEFSDYKRNFLTDKLFAGNIYVGSGASDSEEEQENETNMVNRDFTSWKDSFNKKMSS